MNKRLCKIYRSSRREGMYLYALAAEGLERVPEPLLDSCGRLDEVMELELHSERKLARVDVNKVLESLEIKGFFVQMPPLEGEPEAGMYPALQAHMDRTE